MVTKSTSSPKDKGDTLPKDDLTGEQLVAIGGDVAAVLCRVIRAMPTLGKDGDNKFANYSYVSIDKYYATFSKIAAQHGLTWVSREVEFRLADVSASAEKRGGPPGPAQVKTFAITTYECDLYLHGAAVITGVSRVTIIHGLTGPQTAGSSMSYAEKVFIRTLLKAVTGEKDADAEEPHVITPVQPAPKQEVTEPKAEPKAEPKKAETKSEPDTLSPELRAAINRVEDDLPVVGKEQADWGIVEEIFRVFAPTVPNILALRSWWALNSSAMEVMRDENQDAYGRVLDIFKARSAELSALEKGASA